MALLLFDQAQDVGFAEAFGDHVGDAQEVDDGVFLELQGQFEDLAGVVRSGDGQAEALDNLAGAQPLPCRRVSSE